MTQSDVELDKVQRQVNETRKRLEVADSHVNGMGEGAKIVGLSITGATLEVNMLMKQLFLCAQHNINQYQILEGEFYKQVQGLINIVQTRFGKEKQPEGVAVQ